MNTSQNKNKILCVITFLLSCHFPWASHARDFVHREFKSTGIELVSIANGSGTIQVIGENSPLVAIDASVISGTKDTCGIEAEIAGKEISVKTKLKNNFSLSFNDRCEVNLVIKSPRVMNLRIDTGSGSVQVSDIEGSLNANLGSGNLSANGAFNEANIAAGSGNLSILGMKGSGRLNLGSGDAELTYGQLPPVGFLEIKTGSGNVTLTLPKQASVRTNIKMGSGSQKNLLDNQSSGTFIIHGSIGSGNLTLQNR